MKNKNKVIEKSGCNCKKNVGKLIKTVDDINKSSSKGYARKRSFFGKIGIKTLKLLIYFILSLITFIFLIPITIFKMVLRKNISINIDKPIKYILQTTNK